MRMSMRGGKAEGDRKLNIYSDVDDSSTTISVREVVEHLKEFIDTRIALVGSFDPGKPLYRGVTGERAEELKKLKVGDEISFQGLASTSSKRSVARKFMRKKGALLKITGGVQKSVSITDLSDYSHEDEVLLGESVHFVVVQAYADNQEIELQEVRESP